MAEEIQQDDTKTIAATPALLKLNHLLRQASTEDLISHLDDVLGELDYRYPNLSHLSLRDPATNGKKEDPQGHIDRFTLVELFILYRKAVKGKDFELSSDIHNTILEKINHSNQSILATLVKTFERELPANALLNDEYVKHKKRLVVSMRWSLIAGAMQLLFAILFLSMTSGLSLPNMLPVKTVFFMMGIYWIVSAILKVVYAFEIGTLNRSLILLGWISCLWDAAFFMFILICFSTVAVLLGMQSELINEFINTIIKGGEGGRQFSQILFFINVMLPFVHLLYLSYILLNRRSLLFYLFNKKSG